MTLPASEEYIEWVERRMAVAKAAAEQAPESPPGTFVLAPNNDRNGEFVLLTYGYNREGNWGPVAQVLDVEHWAVLNSLAKAMLDYNPHGKLCLENCAIDHRKDRVFGGGLSDERD